MTVEYVCIYVWLVNVFVCWIGFAEFDGEYPKDLVLSLHNAPVCHDYLASNAREVLNNATLEMLTETKACEFRCNSTSRSAYYAYSCVAQDWGDAVCDPGI